MNFDITKAGQFFVLYMLLNSLFKSRQPSLHFYTLKSPGNTTGIPTNEYPCDCMLSSHVTNNFLLITLQIWISNAIGSTGSLETIRSNLYLLMNVPFCNLMSYIVVSNNWNI